MRELKTEDSQTGEEEQDEASTIEANLVDVTSSCQVCLRTVKPSQSCGCGFDSSGFASWCVFCCAFKSAYFFCWSGVKMSLTCESVLW